MNDHPGKSKDNLNCVYEAYRERKNQKPNVRTFSIEDDTDPIDTINVDPSRDVRKEPLQKNLRIDILSDASSRIVQQKIKTICMF